MGRQQDNKANDCLLGWSESVIIARLVLRFEFLTNQKAFAILADAIFIPDTDQLGMVLLHLIACDLWFCIFFSFYVSRGIPFGVPAAGNTISKHLGMPIKVYLCDDWTAWELSAHQNALWPQKKGAFFPAYIWWGGRLAQWWLLFSVFKYLSSIFCTCKR